MITDKNINYQASQETPEANSKLLSPREWNDLKTKIEWGTATYAERNKYNMIVKQLKKDK